MEAGVLGVFLLTRFHVLLKKTSFFEFVFVLFVMFVGVSSNGVSEDPQVFSGPQEGEQLPPFAVQVWGAGNNWTTETWLDSSETTQGRFPLTIFVHQVTRPSVAYVRALCSYSTTREADGLHTSIVFLAEDVAERTEWVQRARNALPKDVRLGVSPDGVEGPGAYGLNRNVTLTVVLGSGDKVVFNQTLIDPNIPAELPKVFKAITSVIGGEAPDVNSLFPQPTPAARMANARENQSLPAGFEKVEPLLRKLIRKETPDEMVDRIAADIDELLKDFPEAKMRLKEISTKVHEIYGTPRAQSHLRRWAEIPEKEGEKSDSQ